MFKWHFLCLWFHAWMRLLCCNNACIRYSLLQDYYVIKCGWYDNKVQKRITTTHWGSIGLPRPLLFHLVLCITHEDELSTTKNNMKPMYIWANHVVAFWRKFLWVCKQGSRYNWGCSSFFFKGKIWCVRALKYALMVLMFKCWCTWFCWERW